MIVVTGGTGNVGREVVRLLRAAGEDVVTVSRGRGADGATDHAAHRTADLARPAELRPVLDGATALLLLVAGDAPTELVRAAEEAGVARIVLISSLGVATRPQAYAHAAGFEDAVRAGAADWTVLRSGGLASNALGWGAGIRAASTVHAPFVDVALPVVDPADVAAVAAAALTGPGHAGRVHTLTGPEALSPRQQVAVLAELLDRPLSLVELTAEQARAEMVRFMPAPVADATLAVLGTPTPEERAVRADVAQVTGRPASTFHDWAERSIGLFR